MIELARSTLQVIKRTSSHHFRELAPNVFIGVRESLACGEPRRTTAKNMRE